MNRFEHQTTHIQLHKALDELVTDFYKATQNSMSKTPIMELLAWSFEQTLNPIEVPETLIDEN